MDRVKMWVGGGRALYVAVSLLVLSAYACGGSTSPGEEGSAGGSGGEGDAGGTGGAGNAGAAGNIGTSGGAGGVATSVGGTAGSNGGSGAAGAGGEAGAPESSSTGGSAGAPGGCDSLDGPGWDSDGNACGVTPGAWFGIGEASELTTWPARATQLSPTGGVFGSFRSKAEGPQVAFDPENRPVVAWRERDPAGEYSLRIRRWDGGDWVEVATRPVMDYRGDFDLLVDSTGRLVIVESYWSAGVEVSRFANSEWQTLGTWQPPEVEGASVVLDAEDRPILVYRDPLSAAQPVLVHRWTGSTWEDLGTPHADMEGAVLAVRANGDPVVAFYTGYPQQLLLRQWTGSSWDELGGAEGVFVAPYMQTQITLGVDASDRVIVVSNGSYRVWNDSEWSTPAAVAGVHPRLARNAAGALYLVSESDPDDPEFFQERLVYRWANDAWQALPSMTAEYTEPVDLAVGADETLGTAFGFQHVLYRSYADDDWSALASVAGDGIGVKFASYPGVAEVPVVVGASCHIAQWNGTTWDVVPAPTRAGSCDFARNSAGDAYLAFWTLDEDRDNPNLRVVQQTDGGWALLGDPEFQIDAMDNKMTEVAIDSQGRPVVAFSHGDEDSTTQVMGWNGSTWTSWGDSSYASPPGYEVGGLRLALTEDDRPVLALTQSGAEADIGRILHVREWTGAEWRASDVMTRDGEGDWFLGNLAIDATGAAVVSWPSENSLELARWAGADWEQLAPTDAVLASLPLSLRVEARSNGEVLFRYFEGSAWRGLSASDHGGGVSNSAASSSLGKVWVTEHSACLYWMERDEDYFRNDLMRCHEW